MNRRDGRIVLWHTVRARAKSLAAAGESAYGRRSRPEDTIGSGFDIGSVNSGAGGCWTPATPPARHHPQSFPTEEQQGSARANLARRANGSELGNGFYNSPLILGT